MTVTVRELRVDDVHGPRFGWVLHADEMERNVAQAWAEVEVHDASTSTGAGVEPGEVAWSSGRIAGATPWARYAGDPLPARARRRWRVRVGLADGRETEWSPSANLDIGLVAGDDWQARLITSALDVPVFSTSFSVGPEPALRAARLFVSAHGIYEASVNGTVVGDEVLAPGWTTYHRRVAAQAHDVAALLREGENELSITVADGWWRGWLGFRPRREAYGDRLGVIAQLEVTLDDGSTMVVASDDSWRVATGPVIGADLYNGETYDARAELVDVDTAKVDDDFDPDLLFAQSAPPIRRVKELIPVSIDEREPGRWLVDLGQNMVGRLRCTFRGLGAGDEVTLRHAEVLDKDGELFTAPLRTAKCTDVYIARGDAAEAYEPRFTFHGFRYAEVTAPVTMSLAVDDVRGVVITSDLEETGAFACSHPDLNKLHENVRWGWRGNSVGVPTDCPQRDERLGWTGDAQVFAPTATFLTDAEAFLTSWLVDLAADQREDGAVPHVIPNMLDAAQWTGAAGWADAAVVVPWTLYEAYGDDTVLRAAWPSIERWVGYVRSRLDDEMVWSRDFQFGDWLDPDAPQDKPFKAKARFDLVATAYAAWSERLAARIAAVLGRDDAGAYDASATELASTWWSRFGDDAVTTQTGSAMALQFGLAPASERARVGDALVGLVHAAGDHLATGFLGTPLLCPALTATGHIDVAYALLLQDTCPSWLHPVKEGATTIWERWDASRPDVDLSMVSFNHYAYGAIADWMHRTVAGLAPDVEDPGYHHVVVAPQPGGGLTWARASLRSRYGPTSVGWVVGDDRSALTLDVVVPPGAYATVTVPGASSGPVRVGSGSHRFEGSV